MLENTVRDVYLVDEAQLGTRLNETLQSGARAEFDLLLALISQDVTDFPAVSDPLPPGQEELNLRELFQVGKAAPFYAREEDFTTGAELAVLLKSGGMGALHLQQCLHPAPLTLREEIIPGEILGQLSPLKQEKVRRELAGEKLSHTALTEQGEGFLLLREIQESRAGFNASTLRGAA